MEITFNIPAFLFPAISLLLLACNNRFLPLANLVRRLHDEDNREHKNQALIWQISSLCRRIHLIRYMQGRVFSVLFVVWW